MVCKCVVSFAEKIVDKNNLPPRSWLVLAAADKELVRIAANRKPLKVTEQQSSFNFRWRGQR